MQKTSKDIHRHAKKSTDIQRHPKSWLPCHELAGGGLVSGLLRHLDSSLGSNQCHGAARHAAESLNRQTRGRAASSKAFAPPCNLLQQSTKASLQRALRRCLNEAAAFLRAADTALCGLVRLRRTTMQSFLWRSPKMKAMWRWWLS